MIFDEKRRYMTSNSNDFRYISFIQESCKNQSIRSRITYQKRDRAMVLAAFIIRTRKPRSDAISHVFAPNELVQNRESDGSLKIAEILNEAENRNELKYLNIFYD